MKFIRLLITFCAMTVLFQVKAQSVCLTTATDTIAPAKVSLLTCAPGRQIYELEGHTGLRLQWEGNDMVANWGLFDFNSPNFVYRFVKGETDYCAGICPTPYFIHQYESDGRRVTEQALALTPAQAMDVISLVLENIKPENRVYRYNYVLDNCATRPLAIIERAIGDTITLGTDSCATRLAKTFRGVMRHYHTNYPWYQFGIDLALGYGLDRAITSREVAFAPRSLQIMVEDATIPGPDGKPIPLVTETSILSPGAPDGIPDSATPWYLTPLAAMWTLFAFAAIITIYDWRHRKVSRWFDTILYTAYGLTGCVIAFLVFVSVHEASSPNHLILWLNPLLLIIPVSIWLSRRITRYILMMNLVAIAIYASACCFSATWVNAAFIPMILCDTIRSINFILTSNHIKRK